VAFDLVSASGWHDGDNIGQHNRELNRPTARSDAGEKYAATVPGETGNGWS